ncbi:hypothetical protein HNQ60_003857 [Povalibacter uvarum]|uniref:DUF3703 domain-containing protein n=1 Tax=Povalibacter uvarum TaxID=732238 RepID=A0A841HRX6_9GAMM|nr:DUF3703 domain-containing protein [Povalibacter uvarum]MBB6094970.1 hypothetical protein [Povalibacter uvarum]
MGEDSSTVTAYWAFRQMARDHENAGRMDAAFSCLEAAHIIGQRHAVLHVAAHIAMLRLAWRQCHVQEVVGQSLRIVAAALFTWIWVPLGNTGRANVSAFRQMPLPDDLRELLSSERKAT